ncbi:hypothetical protein [Myroides profundi]|uniref:Uncharacterized protein n=1 Tax=Myroides profundi TaxID=480520 RepID=A0AAJ4W2V6_MYRPR|nr:hypothetical protein [Myroides profundi]AJH16300.1 hypothetical protein MPR_3174 [Myroides profundi]SEQ60490.1 hypothetical protein SAMN04488089_104181 [Myroides profundi]
MKTIVFLITLLTTTTSLAQQTKKLTLIKAITEKTHDSNYSFEDDDDSEEVYELLRSTTTFFTYDKSGKIIYLSESMEYLNRKIDEY